jgi:tetratricopeptide (TPR) repeat protein
LDYALSSTVTAEDHFRQGRDALATGAAPEALEHFRSAHQIDRVNPRYRSYYGLSIGMVERRFDRALELCRSAAKEEFFNPDLYHNLARVHLAFGFKAEAIRYLRRGLMIDPANAAMHEDLRMLGTRSRPPLGFLPRRHPLNRLAGQLRRWWSARDAHVEASA